MDFWRSLAPAAIFPDPGLSIFRTARNFSVSSPMPLQASTSSAQQTNKQTNNNNNNNNKNNNNNNGEDRSLNIGKMVSAELTLAVLRGRHVGGGHALKHHLPDGVGEGGEAGESFADGYIHSRQQDEWREGASFIKKVQVKYLQMCYLNLQISPASKFYTITKEVLSACQLNDSRTFSPD